MTQHRFTLMRTVLVPVISGCDCRAALAAARALAPHVLLVGLVKNSPGEPLSAGARLARQVRKWLRELVDGSQVRSRACVHVAVYLSPPTQDATHLETALAFWESWLTNSSPPRSASLQETSRSG